MSTNNDPAAPAGWRKASYSNQNGTCVEVAQTLAGNVAVRDTTNRSGTTLSMPAGAWLTFITSVQH